MQEKNIKKGNGPANSMCNIDHLKLDSYKTGFEPIGRLVENIIKAKPQRIIVLDLSHGKKGNYAMQIINQIVLGLTSNKEKVDVPKFDLWIMDQCLTLVDDPTMKNMLEKLIEMRAHEVVKNTTFTIFSEYDEFSLPSITQFLSSAVQLNKSHAKDVLYLVTARYTMKYLTNEEKDKLFNDLGKLFGGHQLSFFSLFDMYYDAGKMEEILAQAAVSLNEGRYYMNLERAMKQFSKRFKPNKENVEDVDSSELWEELKKLYENKELTITDMVPSQWVVWFNALRSYPIIGQWNGVSKVKLWKWVESNQMKEDDLKIYTALLFAPTTEAEVIRLLYHRGGSEDNPSSVEMHYPIFHLLFKLSKDTLPSQTNESK